MKRRFVISETPFLSDKTASYFAERAFWFCRTSSGEFFCDKGLNCFACLCFKIVVQGKLELQNK